MTTFQPQILQCPFCKQKMYDYVLMSYTVYDSTVYSDSYIVTDSFVNNDSAIRICPACEKPFWVDDNLVDSENPYELVDTLPQAKDILDLPFNIADNALESRIIFYDNLLKQGFAYSNEKKYYLRIRIWWSINNFIRYRTPYFSLLKEIFRTSFIKSYMASARRQKKAFRSFKKLFQYNLQQLIVISETKTDDDYLMIAEMYRELGSFWKANNLLKQVSESKGKAFKKIRRKIFLRRKKVFEV